MSCKTKINDIIKLLTRFFLKKNNDDQNTCNNFIKDIVPYIVEYQKIPNKHKIPSVHLDIVSGKMDLPPESDLWYLRDDRGRTTAHVAAKIGKLNVPLQSPLWCVQDIEGSTPAHVAAEYGHLNFPYTEAIWLIEDNYGNTPLHSAAKRNKIELPEDSPLWAIANKKGQTIAHVAARYGNLKFDYGSRVWLLQDEYGRTPAHEAAIIDNNFAPLNSELWIVPDYNGITPLELRSAGGGQVLLNLNPEHLMRFFRQKNGTLKLPRVLLPQDILGTIRIAAYLNDDERLVMEDKIIFLVLPPASMLVYHVENVRDALGNIFDDKVLEYIKDRPEIRKIYCKCIGEILAEWAIHNEKTPQNSLLDYIVIRDNKSLSNILDEHDLKAQVLSAFNARYLAKTL